MLNLINGKYFCPRRSEGLDEIEVRDDEVRCMYRFNQSACLKENGLCCIVAKKALKPQLTLTLPKCTEEQINPPRSYMWRERTC